MKSEKKPKQPNQTTQTQTPQNKNLFSHWKLAIEWADNRGVKDHSEKIEALGRKAEWVIHTSKEQREIPMLQPPSAGRNEATCFKWKGQQGMFQNRFITQTVSDIKLAFIQELWRNPSTDLTAAKAMKPVA